ncbi:MAG: hypothetical protein EAX95_09340 [Candidatus Thorarchaeota archaeon]|nr:hypothetical protein [Candidatus Thorarchaeota archaeon]
MSEASHDTSVPNPVELDIVKSFGWAILVTETMLYERYLRISAQRSVTTPEIFRTHLMEMEAKGFISLENLHGKRAYRLLLVPDRIEKSGRPQAPLDEMRLVVGSLAARLKLAKRGRESSEKEVPGT